MPPRIAECRTSLPVPAGSIPSHCAALPLLSRLQTSLPLPGYPLQCPGQQLPHAPYNRSRSSYSFTLSCKPIITFRFCSFNFTPRCFLRFLPKLVQQHKPVTPPTEVEYPVISRTQLPDAIHQMLRHILGKPCSVVLQQLDIQHDLFILYSRILIGCAFYPQLFQKVPQFGNASVVLVKFDCIHSCSSSMCGLSLSLMIAHLLSVVNLFSHLPHTLANQKGPAAFAGPFRLWEIMKYQSIFAALSQPVAQRFLLRFFLRGAERAGFWVGTESLERFCSIRYLT